MTSYDDRARAAGLHPENRCGLPIYVGPPVVVRGCRRRGAALALILLVRSCPAHAQDAGPPCAVLLAAERADHAADLERLAAELRRVEAAVADVPDPPSRVVWLAAGVGVGLLLVLGVQAAE